MTFTSADAAKPKVPHKLGLECLGCGAKEASEWRGPGGAYCACCRKAADKARAELKADAKDAKILALELGLGVAMEKIKQLEERLSLVDTKFDKHDRQLGCREDEHVELERRVSRLALQVHQVQPSAGAKRATLNSLPPREQRPLSSLVSVST